MTRTALATDDNDDQRPYTTHDILRVNRLGSKNPLVGRLPRHWFILCTFSPGDNGPQQHDGNIFMMTRNRVWRLQ